MPPPIPSRNRVRTIRHNALVERLDPQQREALRVLLLDPATRLVTAHRWLAALGKPASMAGLCRYRQDLQAEAQRRQEQADQAEREAKEAVAYAIAARDTPPAVFHRASLFLCQLTMTLSVVRLRAVDFMDAVAALRQYARVITALEETRWLLEEADQAAPVPRRAAPVSGGLPA